MKVKSKLLAILFMLSCSNYSYLFGEIYVNTKDSSQLVPFTGKVFLISIGINEFKRHHDLKYCVSDAINFASRIRTDSSVKELTEYPFFNLGNQNLNQIETAKQSTLNYKEQIIKSIEIPDIENNSNKKQIINALKEIAKNAKSGDAFIFYCSSHGDEGNIILSDDTKISAEELFAWSQEIMSVKQLFYLDVSGGEKFIEKLNKKLTKNPEESAVVNLNRVVLSIKGFIYDDDRLGGGVLTLAYTKNTNLEIMDIFSNNAIVKENFISKIKVFISANTRNAEGKMGNEKGNNKDDYMEEFNQLAFFSENKYSDSFIKDFETRNVKVEGPKNEENLKEKQIIRKGETLCLIVGCGKFDNFGVLPNSLNDALAIEETLKNKYKTKVLPLYNPTCNEFRKMLSSLARKFDFEEGSQFLLFSATHGAKDENGVGLMLFKDSKTDEDGLLQNTYALPNIKKAIAQLKATNTILILDICHSGTMFDDGSCNPPRAIEIPKESPIFASNSLSSPAYKNFLNQETNFFIGSSSDQESADGRGEHSPFATVVLDFFNKNDLPVIDSYHLQKEIVNNVMNAGAISIPKFCTYDCEDNGRFLFIKK